MQEIKLPAIRPGRGDSCPIRGRAQKDLDRTVPQKEKVEDEMSCHLVTFHLAEEEYGVGIDSVQEIIRATDITLRAGRSLPRKGCDQSAG